MAWYEPSLPFTAGWGGPPGLTAAPIGTVLGEILQQRRHEQTQLAQNVANTIANVRKDIQGNAYTDQLKSSGLIPSESDISGPFGTKYGESVAELLMRKQQQTRLDDAAKTYDTQIGDETYPLTQDQRVRLAIAAQAARSRAQAKTDVWGPKEWDADLGWVQRNQVTGQVRNFQAFTNPNVQAQKEQTVEDKQRAGVIKDLGRWNLTPDDLVTDREYGTAQPDPKDKSRIKPNTFVATQPGVPGVSGKEQPWVRIKTRGGAYVVMPRATYEYYHDKIHGAAPPPGANPITTPTPDPSASPAPTIAPGTQGGAPVNTPEPGPRMPPGSVQTANGTWVVPGPGGHHYEVDPQTRQTIRQVD